MTLWEGTVYAIEMGSSSGWYSLTDGPEGAQGRFAEGVEGVMSDMGKSHASVWRRR
jgi:hypothetical protein